MHLTPHLCEFGFITTMIKPSNAILGIDKIVVHDKPVPTTPVSLLCTTDRSWYPAVAKQSANLPFAGVSRMVDYRLRGHNVTKTCSILFKHRVCSIRWKSSYIHIRS